MYPEIYRHRSWYSVSLPHHFPSSYAGQITADALNEDILADLLHEVIKNIPGDGGV